jgi:hypothetical protein
MERASNFLLQFPGPLKLRPSKWKWSALLIGTGLVTIGALGQTITSHSTRLSDWFGVAFFGIATVLFAYMLFFAHFELTLDANGFGWTGGRLSERWRWIDVDDFAVVRSLVGGVSGSSLRKGVGFNDKRLNNRKTTSIAMGEALSEAMRGRNCLIPDAFFFSSFGLSMEELAFLMSKWRERALAVTREDDNNA